MSSSGAASLLQAQQGPPDQNCLTEEETTNRTDTNKWSGPAAARLADRPELEALTAAARGSCAAETQDNVTRRGLRDGWSPPAP
jgi:hypothetical protein